MFNRISHHFDDMALAIVIWMCTLPLVGLLVVPLFGVKVGLVAAAALFIAAMIICWGICSCKIFHS
ncbi:MAG TPA: hypothetical protein VFR47_01750 [Anaerolineales bacterium]|nr:hypothetical protein [Anaerolineales bacterium]